MVPASVPHLTEPARVNRAVILIAALAALVSLLPVHQAADCDDGIFLTSGLVLARGGMMYRDVADTKPPLVYAVVGASIRLFDDGWLLLRLLGAAAAGLLCLYAYKLVAFFYGRNAGVIAAAIILLDPLLGLLRLHPSVQALWVAYFWIPGIYYYVTGEARGSYLRLGVAGVLFGLSMLAKQQGIIIALPIAAYAIAARGNWGRRISSLAVAAIFAAALPLSVAAYYKANGAFNDLWQMLYAANFYNPLRAMDDKITFLRNRLAARLLIIAGVGLVLGWIAARGKSEKERKVKFSLFLSRPAILLLTGTLANIVFIAIGPPPSPYYLPPLLVFLILMLAPVMAAIVQGVRLDSTAIVVGGATTGFRKQMLLLPAILLLLSIPFLGTETILLRKGFAAGSTIEQEKMIAKYIQEHVAPDENIFVFSNPVFYYRARRLAETRFMGVFQVFERSKLWHEYKDGVLSAIADPQTKLVLVGKKYVEEWGGELAQPVAELLDKDFNRGWSFEYPYDYGVTAYHRKSSDAAPGAAGVQ